MHQSHITLRRWRLAFCIYLVVLLTIIVAAYARLIPVQIAAFPRYDKIGHAVLLGTASFLGHRATGRRHVRLGRWAGPLAPLLVALAAFGEECLQAFSPYRTFSMLDYACDLIGIVLFYVADRAWAKRRSD